MVNISISILITLVFVQSLAAQTNDYFSRKTPYQLSLKKDIPIGLGAALLYASGVKTLRNEDMPTFSIGQFTQHDIANINFLDRSSAANWNPNMKNIGKPFVYASSMGIPVGLLAFSGNLKSRASLAFMFYEGYYTTGGLVTLSKGLTNRYRPFTYLSQNQVNALSDDFKAEYLEDIEGSDIEDSFFSGDAAKTAYGFVFFAKAFNDYFPESKWRTTVWITSFSAIGLQGYFRVKSGKHFPTDVMLGSLIGGGIGYLIPHLHKKDSKITIGATSNGLSLTYKIQ